MPILILAMSAFLESLGLLRDADPHCGALNMAIDEALLRTLTTPILRVYRWADPAVSFGYFEKFESVAAMHPSADLVRRWTGGGVVEHGTDFTYSLLIGCDERLAQLSSAETYRWVHAALGVMLLGAGLPVEVGVTSAGKVSHACFENPVVSDVLLRGRKIAGAAQRRTGVGLLHQGSIQNVSLPDDWPEKLATALCSRPEEAHLEPAQLRYAEQLAAEKYSSDAWLRRV